MRKNSGQNKHVEMDKARIGAGILLLEMPCKVRETQGQARQGIRKGKGGTQ
jgi:hypothetical protein